MRMLYARKTFAPDQNINRPFQFQYYYDIKPTCNPLLCLLKFTHHIKFFELQSVCSINEMFISWMPSIHSFILFRHFYSHVGFFYLQDLSLLPSSAYITSSYFEGKDMLKKSLIFQLSCQKNHLTDWQNGNDHIFIWKKKNPKTTLLKYDFWQRFKIINSTF